MRRYLLIVSTLAVSLSAAQDWSGKGERKMMRLDADKAVIMHELAVITEENGKLIVGPLLMRQVEGNAEIAEGDEVGMINGKRVATLAQLREGYEQTPIGGEVKLGIRRNNQARIVTFVKKDPNNSQQKMIIRKSDGKPGDEDVLPALGIVIRKQKENVIIAETLPNVSADFKQGDIITSLNGTSVKTVADFTSVFDATEIGKELRIELVRDGKTVSVTTTRPEPRGNVIIKTK